jgi:predicted GIY-YIG superfamily endonuclease
MVDELIHIYIYENLINGKVYIGQTRDLNIRHMSHKCGNKNIPFDFAIKKYGIENFSFNVITCSTSQEIADRAGYKHSPETIKKIAESNKDNFKNKTWIILNGKRVWKDKV